MDNPKVFTYEQVAEYLQVSEPKVRELVSTGKLKVVWLGYKTPRVTQEAIDELLTPEAKG